MRIVPYYRAICAEPGPGDVFIVLLINGRRAALNPVADYPQMRAAAERIAVQGRCRVKLLPLAEEEVVRFLGITPGQFAPDDAKARQIDIRSCADEMFRYGSADQIDDMLSRLVRVQ